jgi:hypothetical protein
LPFESCLLKYCSSSGDLLTLTIAIVRKVVLKDLTPPLLLISLLVFPELQATGAMPQYLQNFSGVGNLLISYIHEINSAIIM